MTEHEERFMLEIVRRVPADKIVEMHLFAPMRQGGAESGVAVVAVAELAADADDGARGDDAYAGDDVLVEVVKGAEHVDAVVGAVEEGALAEKEHMDERVAEAEEAESAEGSTDGSAEDGALGSTDGSTLRGADGTGVARYAVYSARYRYQYKGADRGRWEFEIDVEADAPLSMVDRVVSGVLQRSGEQGEPTRLSQADIRAAIGDVNCVATTE